MQTVFFMRAKIFCVCVIYLRKWCINIYTGVINNYDVILER